MSDNGTVSFTKQYPPFELDGVTFKTQAVSAHDWGETLVRVETEDLTVTKEVEEAKTGVGRLVVVNAEGLAALVRLAVVEDQRAEWDEISARTDFGTLNSLKRWVEEKMYERPFSPEPPSSDGPGTDAASSTAEDISPVEVH